MWKEKPECRGERFDMLRTLRASIMDGICKENVDYFFLSAVKIEEQLADGGFCQKRLDIKITDDAVELHDDLQVLEIIDWP